jgi:hypothetical protein
MCLPGFNVFFVLKRSSTAPLPGSRVLFSSETPGGQDLRLDLQRFTASVESRDFQLELVGLSSGQVTAGGTLTITAAVL